MFWSGAEGIERLATLPSVLRCMGQPPQHRMNWPSMSAAPRLRTPESVNKETRAMVMLAFHTLGRANLQLPACGSCPGKVSQQSEPPHKTSPLIVVVSRLQPRAEQERRAVPVETNRGHLHREQGDRTGRLQPASAQCSRWVSREHSLPGHP